MLDTLQKLLGIDNRPPPVRHVFNHHVVLVYPPGWETAKSNDKPKPKIVVKEDPPLAQLPFPLVRPKRRVVESGTATPFLDAARAAAAAGTSFVIDRAPPKKPESPQSVRPPASPKKEASPLEDSGFQFSPPDRRRPIIYGAPHRRQPTYLRSPGNKHFGGLGPSPKKKRPFSPESGAVQVFRKNPNLLPRSVVESPALALIDLPMTPAQKALKAFNMLPPQAQAPPVNPAPALGKQLFWYGDQMPAQPPNPEPTLQAAERTKLRRPHGVPLKDKDAGRYVGPDRHRRGNEKKRAVADYFLAWGNKRFAKRVAKDRTMYPEHVAIDKEVWDAYIGEDGPAPKPDALAWFCLARLEDYHETAQKVRLAAQNVKVP
ncbi:hypothetical protein BDV98DRAFT_126972 [Pterulicium gracile]|uniref:Uncharacterized protein n=1 Tax=Pterulicium gracile TaxID=1884261 RepID=A0A5C3QHE1_9AGAR|nr:hypothetical protein BDV98DRAFT_126972 [Pterula gracilis]